MREMQSRRRLVRECFFLVSLVSLVSLIMDIYSNQDLLDFKLDIKKIESIANVKFEKLVTPTIASSSKKADYQVGIDKYVLMAKELANIVNIKDISRSASVLEKLYYG